MINDSYSTIIALRNLYSFSIKKTFNCRLLRLKIYVKYIIYI